MARQCAIFDLDGTLVDSELLNNQAFVDLLPDITEGVAGLAARYRGKKLAKILGDIELRLGRSLPMDFESRYRGRVAQLFTSELAPTPGTVEILEEFSFSRFVASSAPMQNIQQALDVSGLASHFSDNLYRSYDIGSWKPDPTLFLHAADRTEFLPRQCVVIEDSDVGVEASLVDIAIQDSEVDHTREVG